ncbi:TolC family protein [soil metagenome]
MNTARIVIVFLAGLLAIGCAASSPPWQPATAQSFAKPLTMKEAIALAESQDLLSAEWKARQKAAGAAVRQAWTPPNPTLNLAWEDVGLKDAAGASQSTSSVGVSYPVLFWITRPWEIASARHRQAAAEQTILAEKRDLAIEVGTSWLDISALAQKERFATDAVDEASDSLRFVSTERSLGDASSLDETRAEAEVLRARAELADVVAAKRAAQLAFAFALGADRPYFPDVSDAMPAKDESIPPAMMLPSTNGPAFPEVAAARESMRAAQADVTAEYMRILPLTDTQGSVLRKNSPDGMSNSYGVDVPIPLFDWNSAGIARARAERLLASIGAERTRRQAAQRLSANWENWKASREKYLTLVTPLQEKSRSIGHAGQTLFEQGEISYADYLQSRRDATVDALAAVDSWRDARAAEWTLLCLVNGASDRASK